MSYVQGHDVEVFGNNGSHHASTLNEVPMEHLRYRLTWNIPIPFINICCRILRISTILHARSSKALKVHSTKRPWALRETRTSTALHYDLCLKSHGPSDVQSSLIFWFRLHFLSHCCHRYIFKLPSAILPQDTTCLVFEYGMRNTQLTSPDIT